MIPPKEDASAEERRAFYEALGAPSDPKGYGVPEGWQKPEGFELDQALIDRMATAAHEAGIPKAAWDRLFTDFTAAQLDQTKGLVERIVAHREQLLSTLKNEWGAAFETKAKGALEAAHYLFGDQYDTVNGLVTADGTKVLDHPEIVKALARLHDAMGEGKMVEGVVRRETMTPEESEAKFQELTADPEFMAAYLDDAHAGHRAAVEKMRQIQHFRAGRQQQRSETGASGSEKFPAGQFVTSRWQA